MSDTNVIAVVGATGSQGGGLVRAILDDPKKRFHARALTRDPNSDKAKELAKLGAEVVAADLEDLDSVTAAFTGAHAAYGVTFFWEHFSPDTEKAHANNIAEAARRANLSHVIWSTFEDTRKWVPLSDDRMPTLQGKYKVPHFDAKAEANELFLERDLPVTFLLTSNYWDNMIHLGMGPKRNENGKLEFVLPMGDKKLPGIAAEDIGKVAFGIFAEGPGMAGKTIGAAGDHLTGTEMAASLTKALGEEVTYVPVPPAVYRSFGFPGADDLGNMFQFKADFETDYCGARDLKTARSLGGDLMTFDQWLGKYGSRIAVG